VKLPASKDDTLRELTLDPRLALLAGVLSEMPRIRVFLDRILYKQAGGSPTKAHIDAPFLCFEDPRSLACWIALADTTAENGALAYYVGSHRRPLTDKSLEPDGTISAHDPSLNAGLLRSLPARAGDVVFHNARTIHLAGANNTPETRRAYTIQYMPDGVAFNGITPNFLADCAPAQGAPLDMPCFPRVL
jgi:phytanoyl-CoA hydroxylase